MAREPRIVSPPTPHNALFLELNGQAFKPHSKRGGDKRRNGPRESMYRFFLVSNPPGTMQVTPGHPVSNSPDEYQLCWGPLLPGSR